MMKMWNEGPFSKKLIIDLAYSTVFKNWRMDEDTVITAISVHLRPDDDRLTGADLIVETVNGRPLATLDLHLLDEERTRPGGPRKLERPIETSKGDSLTFRVYVGGGLPTVVEVNLYGLRRWEVKP